jgi:hypothetical protein
MLVQNKFKKDDIISFRISTGEEIVAKLVTEDMTQYIVTRPLALIQRNKRFLFQVSYRTCKRCWN